MKKSEIDEKKIQMQAICTAIEESRARMMLCLTCAIDIVKTIYEPANAVDEETADQLMNDADRQRTEMLNEVMGEEGTVAIHLDTLKAVFEKHFAGEVTHAKLQDAYQRLQMAVVRRAADGTGILISCDVFDFAHFLDHCFEPPESLAVKH